MATITELIEYSRRCYESDNRETGIADLHDARIRHLRFVDGQELIYSGTSPRIALPSAYGEKLRKDTFNHRRDKTLIYAGLVITGSGEGFANLPQQVCAPIVFTTCEFNEIDGSIFLEPNLAGIRYNFPSLYAIASATGADISSVEDCLLKMPALPWARETVHSIAARLSGVLPSVDFHDLANYPELTSAVAMRSLRSTDRSCGLWKCHATAAIALLPNSPETRGVLHELTQLTAMQRFPKSLKQMFAPEMDVPNASLSQRDICVPSILSDRQNQVLRSASSRALTLVIGPPGTGKSHTIASIALDHLARGQSVLIASRMDQAVNVVADKIDAQLGGSESVVRAGRREHMRELKAKLERLLQHMPSNMSDATAVPVKTLRRELAHLTKQTRHLEGSLPKVMHYERVWSELQAQTMASSWKNALLPVYKAWNEWQVKKVDLIDAIHLYDQKLVDRCESARAFLRATLQQRMKRFVNRQRGDLKKFLQAMRARSDGKQQQLFEEIKFSILLHAFPIWLCKLSDLSDVLPLKQELFDVAILDESTQCDLASCLPLFYRAKRVVVVGDPQQLRHLSFLPESRLRSIAQDCDLSELQQMRFQYRDKSILDAVSDAIPTSSQISFLNEHFRSVPDIIDFSNSMFYQGTLALMRQRPTTLADRAVHVENCSGTRDEMGRNVKEAMQILRDVQKVVRNQQTLGYKSSIGILSPFRDQVDFLNELVEQNFTYEQMVGHDMLVGTAHTFQGEERDVMYISFVADSSAHAATFRFLNQPQVLNVAVTRGRNEQAYYISFDPKRLPRDSLLRILMERSAAAKMEPVASENARDSRSEICEQLQQNGVTCHIDFTIAGTRLDIVCQYDQNFVGIHLVGFAGSSAEPYSIERHRILNRTGLPVMLVSYRRWCESRNEIVEAILSKLRC